MKTVKRVEEKIIIKENEEDEIIFIDEDKEGGVHKTKRMLENFEIMIAEKIAEKEAEIRKIQAKKIVVNRYVEEFSDDDEQIKEFVRETMKELSRL